MDEQLLKLDNQLCFRLYALSRLVTRAYQPYLDKLGITYPQYLVLMVLWESDKQPVNDIGKKLFLNTNTLTPLLKRMEADAIVVRKRDDADERRVLVCLTEKGKEMKQKAICIPVELSELLQNQGVDRAEISDLRTKLDSLIGLFSQS
ncbi:MAG: MarR family winged helix-turn-helix transcriptional regulator [Phocaeicola sp.]